MNLLCRPLQNGSRSKVARQVVLAVSVGAEGVKSGVKSLPELTPSALGH